jgi:hypothetical protein
VIPLFLFVNVFLVFTQNYFEKKRLEATYLFSKRFCKNSGNFLLIERKRSISKRDYNSLFKRVLKIQVLLVLSG